MNLAEKYAYMATGKPYDDLDPILIDRRNRATELTNALNAAPKAEQRAQLFQELIGRA